MVRKRKDRIQERRSFAVGLVRRILHRVAGGDLDPYEGYRQVQAIYSDHSGLLEELKTFLDLPGMASKDHIIADPAFRDQVVTSAKEWLAAHPAEASA